MASSRHRVDVFLAPGELAVRSVPINIKTILGSCVAVCLWNPRRGVGGVNHFLLPSPAPNDEPDARFGSWATPRLIDEVCRAGGNRAELEAAVVGGGCPVQTLRSSRIGEENTAMALAVLESYRIPVVRQETGGVRGRKILFNPHTGELIVRVLQGRDAEPVSEVGA
jgi:chemotaxis protein CheD